MTEKKFIKLAKKHLFALETPRNAFGGTKLEVFGIEKLYKQLLLHNVSQQRELLIAYRTMIEFDVKHEDFEESVDYFLKHKESYL